MLRLGLSMHGKSPTNLTAPPFVLRVSKDEQRVVQQNRFKMFTAETQSSQSEKFRSRRISRDAKGAKKSRSICRGNPPWLPSRMLEAETSLNKGTKMATPVVAERLPQRG